MNTTKVLKLPNHGYSADKRKRRNQHREAAKSLIKQNIGVFGVSESINAVAWWHLQQAKYLSY